jgi:hypothetical protein
LAFDLPDDLMGVLVVGLATGFAELATLPFMLDD